MDGPKRGPLRQFGHTLQVNRKEKSTFASRRRLGKPKLALKRGSPLQQRRVGFN
jgi:hypothetical protein